ncbi:bifunctional riboflavin kinase/FAD synthetase [Bdellovibrionota bacterium]
MKVFHGHKDFELHETQVVATVGNFDGVHAGHREILRGIVKRAQELGGLSLVYTFHPHPVKVLAPTKDFRLICNLDVKLKRLEEAGVDIVVVEPFNLEFSKITFSQFIHDILLKNVKISEVFVGHDFNFGKDREGTPEKLKEIGAEVGLSATIIPAFKVDQAVVSSSLIRKTVLEGDVEQASRYLTSPHELHGTVTYGDQRGAELGFPTANVETTDELIPKPGVYITETEFEEVRHHSLTNIGLRPTFDTPSEKPVIETHLLDFSGDIYGEKVTLYFLKRIRDEQPFETVDELKEQISADIARGKEFFGKNEKNSSNR